MNCCCCLSRASNVREYSRGVLSPQPCRPYSKSTWRYRTRKHIWFTDFDVRQRLVRSFFLQCVAMLMWISGGSAENVPVAMTPFFRRAVDNRQGGWLDCEWSQRVPRANDSYFNLDSCPVYCGADPITKKPDVSLGISKNERRDFSEETILYISVHTLPTITLINSVNVCSQAVNAERPTQVKNKWIWCVRKGSRTRSAKIRGLETCLDEENISSQSQSRPVCRDRLVDLWQKENDDT